MLYTYLVVMLCMHLAASHLCVITPRQRGPMNISTVNNMHLNFYYFLHILYMKFWEACYRALSADTQKHYNIVLHYVDMYNALKYHSPTMVTLYSVPGHQEAVLCISF